MKQKIRTAFVLGSSSDIGTALCLRLMQEGWHVTGTGRSKTSPKSLSKNPHFTYIPCNLAQRGAVVSAVRRYAKFEKKWDLFVSSVGTMEPIGSFFDLDFNAWEESFRVNSLEQLRALHALWPYRNKKNIVDVMLMAGGGTNNPFTNYSAYCAAKIALIKMTELLDDEEKKLNIFIVGPGFVRTRIHEETLKAGRQAGAGYAKTLAFLKTEGTPMDRIYAHMQWCMQQGREVAGGRNFSTQHDAWDMGSVLADQLRDHADAFRLRRFLPLPAKNQRQS